MEIKIYNQIDDNSFFNQFLSNYDSPFVNFFHNHLRFLSDNVLIYLYRVTHRLYNEEDRYGILFDLMDYLEVISLLFMKIDTSITKDKANLKSVYIFGNSISDIEKILSINCGYGEKVVAVFIEGLNRYLEPTGMKRNI